VNAPTRAIASGAAIAMDGLVAPEESGSRAGGDATLSAPLD
jgi:hypothetical protein